MKRAKQKSSGVETCQAWYDQSYDQMAFSAQRLYPNEELCRFLGRRYFSSVPRAKRGQTRILEIGCGTCANLWMVAREGFEAHGLDLSPKAIDLGRQMLDHWGVKARLAVGSMTKLPYPAGHFDAVVDVFSSNCLNLADFKQCLAEVRRVLKPGGGYFIYTPSAASDAFRRHQPARKIDRWTLDGIHRKSSPYYGNFYPFRFVTPTGLRRLLSAHGLRVTYLETVARTYGDQREYFEFVTIVGEKS